MNNISLFAEGITDVTIVPNTFIDSFMPSANGAYVKVYLYLLRCFSGHCPELTISSIADQLDNTEKDIIRALNYWEKQNLLTLTKNEQKEITAVHIVDINSLPIQKSSYASEIDSQLDEIAITIHTDNKPVERQTYSEEKINALTSNDKIKYAMDIIELYLGRPLKAMDFQLIQYLYEDLHFAPELIMYLYEYCVSKGKKDTSYMEAIALSWAEEGIDTEEKAKEANVIFSDRFNTVKKAFGLNRAPGQIERQYIRKWAEVFGFSDEIINEACNRTILRTQKPDFKYADKILETWFKKGAKNLTDIARLDEEFTKGNHKTDNGKITTIKPSTNKFNQYPQRTYTAKDYAELEKKLMNKGL